MIPQCGGEELANSSRQMSILKRLSTKRPPRETFIQTDDDIHCTFAPKRDAKAIKAMKVNPF